MESSLISNTALVRTTNWKGHRVTSKVPLVVLPHSFVPWMHEKRNERERYEWEQWSMANPWRTRGDRNSRWKDTVVGAYRRHRWAQKARKRPVAIRLAGWDRRWHRTKLESTASVAVRIERGKRRERERKRRGREREREGACVPVSIVGRQSLNGRGTRAMNEERAWIRGWIEVLDSPCGRWSCVEAREKIVARYLLLLNGLSFIFAFAIPYWNWL